jgi:cytochrome c553
MKNSAVTVSSLVLGSLLAAPALAQSEGAEYYNDRYCMTCHGADGMGSEGIGGWEYKPAEITLQADAAAGAPLYAACASCHGSAAEGNEALGAPALAGQNDWYLFTQLKNFKAGYRGTHAGDTYGAQMAPMAAALPDDTAILNVVSYINTLGR